MADESGFSVYKGNVGEHSLSGYGPIVSVKRPVRTRMRGAVESGGEKPPLIRLSASVEFVSPDLFS